MEQLTATVEMLDGTIHEVRVLTVDKIRYEDTAQRRDWGMNEGPRAHAFLAFAALQRTGISFGDFDAFLNAVADIDLARTAPDPTSGATLKP